MKHVSDEIPLASMAGQNIRIDRGGPESRYGKLLSVKPDHLVLDTEEEGIIYYLSDHIKSVTTDVNTYFVSDDQPEQTRNYIDAEDFHEVAGRMLYRFVQINRGGPEKICGVLAAVYRDHVVIIVNKELIKVFVQHIRNISFASPAKESGSSAAASGGNANSAAALNGNGSQSTRMSDNSRQNGNNSSEKVQAQSEPTASEQSNAAGEPAEPVVEPVAEAAAQSAPISAAAEPMAKAAMTDVVPSVRADSDKKSRRNNENQVYRTKKAAGTGKRVKSIAPKSGYGKPKTRMAQNRVPKASSGGLTNAKHQGTTIALNICRGQVKHLWLAKQVNFTQKAGVKQNVH